MKTLLLTLLLAAGINAQQNINLSSPPPPGVPSIGNTQTGVPGAVTYFYQIVTNYPAGSALSSVVQQLNSNATLTSGNFNTVTWNANPGALSYDVLRFTTNAGYVGTCTCLVGNVVATATLTINDQSNTVTSYTIGAPATGATSQIYINTRDHVAPELRYSQSGIDEPLNATIGGSTVGVYTTGTGGTTAFMLVKISAGTVVKALTSDTAPGVVLGIAKETTLAGSIVNVVFGGTSSCIFDASGSTTGNLVGVSTTIAGDCKDLGTALVSGVASNISIIGRALATVASGVARISVGIGDGGTAGSTTSATVTLDDCATTAACPNTLQSTVRVVIGRGTLVSGTPSTYVVTAIAPAFTSATTYTCTAQDTTTIANNIGVLAAGYVSGSAVTFTGPNTNTDGFRFSCTGY